MGSLDAFDLSANTPEQRDIIEQAVARCTFDFTRLLPGLRATVRRDVIPVTWEDLSRMTRSADSVTIAEPVRRHDDHEHAERRATLGLFYYSGRIVMHAGLVDQPLLAQEVFLAEAAHAADRFFMRPEHRRAIWALWHPGEQTDQHDQAHGWAVPFSEWTGEMDQPGRPEVGYFDSGLEAWMATFTRAFSDITPTLESAFAHRLPTGTEAKVRDLLAPPYFALAGSKVFHDQHRRIGTERAFETRDAAAAAGLRPCGVCKP